MGIYGATNMIAIRSALQTDKKTDNTHRRDRTLKHSCNSSTISGVVLIFCFRFLSFLFCQRFILIGKKRSVKFHDEMREALFYL